MATRIDFLHQDCLEGMKAMPASSVDLVVSSPPYNLGIEYDTYQDHTDRFAFIQWCLEWATELKRVMHDDASFFLNLRCPKKPAVTAPATLGTNTVRK